MKGVGYFIIFSSSQPASCLFPAAVIGWLSTLSFRMLFPTCVQSLIFSEEDDDASFGGDEEQGPSRDSDQVIP
jgi:hypothetical protein